MSLCGCKASAQPQQGSVAEIGKILLLGLEGSGKTLLAKQLQVVSGVCPPHRKLARAVVGDAASARAFAVMAAAATADTVPTIGTEMFLIAPPPPPPSSSPVCWVSSARTGDDATGTASPSSLKYGVGGGMSSMSNDPAGIFEGTPAGRERAQAFAARIQRHERISIREVGGAMLPLWPQYYAGVQAILYCIDTSDRKGLAQAAVELWDMLQAPLVSKLPICVVLTKPPPSREAVSCNRLNIDLVVGLSDLKRALPNQMAIMEVNSLIYARASAFQALLGKKAERPWSRTNKNPDPIPHLRTAASDVSASYRYLASPRPHRSGPMRQGGHPGSESESAKNSASPSFFACFFASCSKPSRERSQSTANADAEPRPFPGSDRGPVLEEDEVLQVRAMQDLLVWCWHAVYSQLDCSSK